MSQGIYRQQAADVSSISLVEGGRERGRRALCPSCTPGEAGAEGQLWDKAVLPVWQEGCAEEPARAVL